MRDHDGRVDIDRDQAAVRSRRGGAGQGPGPLAGRRPGCADRAQRPRRVSSQGGDQPGYHRVGGDRAGCARSTATSARQSPPSPTATARSVIILPGSCTRPRRPVPAQPRRQSLLQAGHDGGAAQQDAARVPDQALPVSGDQQARTADGILHPESAFALVRAGPSTSPILPVQRHFLHEKQTARSHSGRRPRLGRVVVPFSCYLKFLWPMPMRWPDGFVVVLGTRRGRPPELASGKRGLAPSVTPDDWPRSCSRPARSGDRAGRPVRRTVTAPPSAASRWAMQQDRLLPIRGLSCAGLRFLQAASQVGQPGAQRRQVVIRPESASNARA
jgi:hypothetical protein